MDIVLFGATSFVGQIISQYLLDQYGVDQTLSWAIAGRSKSKLEKLKLKLGDKATKLQVLIADADSEPDLRNLCKQTKVMISTVGPYDRYGTKLVKVCAEMGTDYVDLTGENLWVKQMIELYDSSAKASGARIVHGCGFDSIPSDMGVWFLQQYFEKAYQETAVDVQMRVHAIKGSLSGGTVDSLVNFMEKAAQDRSLFGKLTDVYLLCPSGTQRQPTQKQFSHASYDAQTRSWIAPFFMAPTNEAVVLRSNALNHYSPNFVYQEAMSLGTGVKGALLSYALTGFLKAFMGSMALGPTRQLLTRCVLPRPGEGPSQKSQQNGYFDLRFYGQSSKGKKAIVQVKGKRDPGYGATARMLAEAGICLAKDMSKTEKAGGILTPACVFDQRLVDRLSQNAEIGFNVVQT